MATRLIIWDKKYQRVEPGINFTINFEGQLIHSLTGRVLDLNRYSVIKQHDFMYEASQPLLETEDDY